MTDEEAIRQVISRYAHTADAGKIEALADLFAPDGAIQHYGVKIQPRDKIIAFTRLRSRGIDPEAMKGRAKHLCLGSIIEVEGDTATAESDVVALALLPTGWQVIAAGLYNDIFVKLDGRWYFKERVSTLYQTEDGSAYARDSDATARFVMGMPALDGDPPQGADAPPRRPGALGVMAAKETG